VRLRPAEGGKTEGRQAGLQGSEVLATKGEVIQQVAGAVLKVSMDPAKPWIGRPQASHHGITDGREFPESAFDLCTFPTNRAVSAVSGHRNLLRRLNGPVRLLASSLHLD
jgi:hypothetical protein